MSSEKIDRIRAEFEKDLKERPLATRAGDIPAFYESITPEWLTAILTKDTPGALVTGYSLGPVDTGTSNRRRVFVTYNDVGTAAGLPASVFCKASHDLANRILMSSAAAHSEVSFYELIRPELGIEVPVSLFAAYDPVKYTSIVMLKDIGNSVTFASHKTRMTQARVESQMDLLAGLHGRFYDSDELNGRLSGMFSFSDRFMNLVDNHDLQPCCEEGLRAAEEVVPARLLARESEVWPATIASAQIHRVLPRTITHGDVHLKNWYVTNDDRMGLGDWQVTSIGHWSRDVAYTIATALTVEDRRRHERDLLAYYLDRLHAAGGAKVSFDDAWLRYRQQMPSVVAWWTMTLTPTKDMPDMQPLDITLEFIKRTTCAMDDLDSIGAFG